MIRVNASPLVQEFFETGQAADCPVIDCHAHYGPYQGIYFPHVTAEQMVNTMNRSGVRLAICASHAALVDPARGNTEMAEICARFPQHFRAYLAINPNYPTNTKEEIERFDSLEGFVGLKFLSTYHRYPLTGENYTPALVFAQERKLPVLMHTWGGSAFDSPQHVAQLAERYPETPFLMGHSGHGDWEGAIKTAVDHGNVYLELCAAYAVRGVIELFCEHVGSHRILFGTDLPWFDPHYGIGCVLMADISDADRHNILHRNAEKLYGITAKS
ncbi:MAG: amidohydrolase family protein [Candidatus Zipacnadales bacterium]